MVSMTARLCFAEAETGIDSTPITSSTGAPVQPAQPVEEKSEETNEDEQGVSANV